MSFTRIVRPWVPTLIFVTIVLVVMLVINYNTGSQYVLGDEERTESGFMSYLKRKIKPSALPNTKWREALPWDIDPKRFLPNFYTYKNIMDESDIHFYKRSNIAYIHVPRSGGTTMNSCLNMIAQKINSFDSTIRFVNEHKLYNAELDLSGKGEEEKTILSGEFAFGACDFMKGRPCSYVLLMREPYDRVISSYTFCQQYDDDESDFYCSVKTKGISIVDWAIIEGSPLFRQLVAHPSNCGEKFENHFDFASMIDAPSGILKTAGKYPCWMKLKAFIKHQLTENQTLKLAQYVANNIEFWFAAVGTLEDKNILLQTMQDMYYIPIHNICEDVHIANNSRISEEQKEIYRNMLKDDLRVAEALREDLILYERVKEVTILQSMNHFESHNKNIVHHHVEN